MNTREVSQRDMTLHAHLRACGVDPFFLYQSFIKQLPTPLPFPTVEDMRGEFTDAILEYKMKEDREDLSLLSDMQVRSNWAMQNGQINFDKSAVEISPFEVMDVLKDLRLTYAIDNDKKIYGLAPQREVW